METDENKEAEPEYDIDEEAIEKFVKMTGPFFMTMYRKAMNGYIFEYFANDEELVFHLDEKYDKAIMRDKMLVKAVCELMKKYPLFAEHVSNAGPEWVVAWCIIHHTGAHTKSKAREFPAAYEMDVDEEEDEEVPRPRPSSLFSKSKSASTVNDAPPLILIDKPAIHN